MKKDNPFYVMKFFENSSLYEYLSKQTSNLPDNLIIKMALTGGKGVAYLHSKNIIHGDIKSLNFLVDDDLSLIICDFDQSRVHSRQNLKMTMNVGSTPWRAPEIWRDKPYSLPADCYSFGMMMSELLTLKIPFHEYESYSLFELITKITKKKTPTDSSPFPRTFSPNKIIQKIIVKSDTNQGF